MLQNSLTSNQPIKIHYLFLKGSAGIVRWFYLHSIRNPMATALKLYPSTKRNPNIALLYWYTVPKRLYTSSTDSIKMRADNRGGIFVFLRIFRRLSVKGLLEKNIAKPDLEYGARLLILSLIASH